MRLLFTLCFIGLSALLLDAQNLVVLSKASGKSGEAYKAYLLNADSGLVLKIAYEQPQDSIDKWLEMASGVVITGGEDVNPEIYGKGDELEKCGTINHYRDSLEIYLIRYAREKKMPLLGICRGQQILNVTFGGSLHTDIPTDIENNLEHRNEEKNAKHNISIENNSIFHSIVTVDSGEVNSFHHQCVDELAEGFKVVAFSSDGVVEAIEYTGNDWSALGVQYHPERMRFSDPLAGNIALWFVRKLNK